MFISEKSNMTLVLVSLILGAFVVLYLYLTSNYKYWQKRSIPCPNEVLPGFGHMLPVISRRINWIDYVFKIYNENKDHSMIGIYDFMSPSLMILEPELIKKVLQINFSSFAENTIKLDPKLDPLLSNNALVLSGEKWVNSRKCMAYALTSMRLKILFENIKKVCDTMKNYIDGKLNNVEKVEFELKYLFSKYSAQVGAAVGFGVDGYCFDDEKEDISFQKLGHDVFKDSLRNKIALIFLLFIPPLNKIFKMGLIPKHVDHFFRTLVENLVTQRKKDGMPRNDFLQFMIEQERTKGNKFDMELLTANMMIFVLDIYETPSSVMSFVGFHLASYPEIQEKLREEVVSVINKHNGEITYEGLKEMTYMDQVINETMRLLPIQVVMKKRCTAEFELKGSDDLICRLQPGTNVLIPISALQRDPQYWENPEEYNPERFSPESKQDINKFVFLPFGEGPRNCVGIRMAQIQMKAGLAAILTKYRLKLSPKTKLPLKLLSETFIPVPEGGIWVYLQHL